MSVPRKIHFYVFCILLCIVFSAVVLGDGLNNNFQKFTSERREIQNRDIENVEDNEVENDEVENDEEENDEVESDEEGIDEVEECKYEIMQVFDNEKSPSENFDEAFKNYTVGHFEEHTNDTNGYNHTRGYFFEFLHYFIDEDLETAESPKEFCDNHYNIQYQKNMCYEALAVLLKYEGTNPEQRDEFLTQMTGLDVLHHLYDNQINTREEYLNLLKNQLDVTDGMYYLSLDDYINEFKVGAMLLYFTHIQEIVANKDNFPSIEAYCIDAINVKHGLEGREIA